jgi:hypothetical protein
LSQVAPWRRPPDAWRGEPAGTLDGMTSTVDAAPARA